MAVNKVVIDGVTAIDLTNDTVSADKLLKGITAHDSSGKLIVGTMGGDSLLPKPYALSDFWDFTQNVDTDRNSWKSLMSEKAITGDGGLTQTTDFVRFSEQFTCSYNPLYAFTVYAIIRAAEYVSGCYDLIATSYGNTPYFNVGSYNGTFDIITSPQAQQMLYTNVPAYGEWHVVAMTFEGTCDYGKGSRFARNTVDSLVTVRKLKEHHVEIYFEKENIFTFDSKGELLITIMSSLAQEESRSISENVTWGQRKRFADGKVTMPYKQFLGYERGEGGVPVINEKEAEVVRLIYKLFLQGKTATGICKQLELMNIPTPAGKTKWNQSTVMSILQNEKYKGDALLQKKFTTDFLTKKQKKNEGEVPQYYVEGSHPAIISEIDFDMVQAEIARRQALGRSYSGSSVFSSKLVCGDCGGFYGKKVWHSNDTYRRIVWRCNAKFSGKSKCVTPTLSTETVQEKFLIALNQLIGSRQEIIQACEEMRIIVCDCTELDAEIDALNEEIQIVSELVSQCIKENSSTQQSQEEYNKKYNRLVNRYEKASSRLKKVTADRNARNQRDREIRIFIESLKQQPLIVEAWDETLWLSLLDTATVYGDGSIAFLFKNGTELNVPPDSLS